MSWKAVYKQYILCIYYHMHDISIKSTWKVNIIIHHTLFASEWWTQLTSNTYFDQFKYQQFTCNLWMHIWFVRIFFYNMRHRPINLSKHVYLVSINYMLIAKERFLSWKTKCYCYIKENIYGLQRMDYLHNYWVCLSKGNSN